MGRPAKPPLTMAEKRFVEGLIREGEALAKSLGEVGPLPGYGWIALAESVSENRIELGGEAVSPTWLKQRFEAAQEVPVQAGRNGRWMRPR